MKAVVITVLLGSLALNLGQRSYGQYEVEYRYPYPAITHVRPYKESNEGANGYSPTNAQWEQDTRIATDQQSSNDAKELPLDKEYITKPIPIAPSPLLPPGYYNNYDNIQPNIQPQSPVNIFNKAAWTPEQYMELILAFQARKGIYFESPTVMPFK